MRNALANEITKLAAEDERIVLLSGDIGNRLFDTYKARYPDRFYNCGVAEQNMTGMAAGLALCGLRPVTYTITPFATTRCLEQIRVDVCYHNVPVIIVGTGSGLSYAGLGATHHSCEDVAFLRTLPHMSVVCPGDPYEVRQALRAAARHDGPVYIRIGKKGEPAVHDGTPPFALGSAITVRPGTDVCLLSTGSILAVAVEAAQLLETQGISARVESVHTIKPLDKSLLAEVFVQYPMVVTIEEHSRLGGLGGSVAEWLADRAALTDVAAPQAACGWLLRIGTADTFLHEAGDQDHARARYGLTAQRIAEQAAHAFRRRVATHTQTAPFSLHTNGASTLEVGSAQ